MLLQPQYHTALHIFLIQIVLRLTVVITLPPLATTYCKASLFLVAARDAPSCRSSTVHQEALFPNLWDHLIVNVRVVSDTCSRYSHRERSPRSEMLAMNQDIDELTNLGKHIPRGM